MLLGLLLLLLLRLLLLLLLWLLLLLRHLGSKLGRHEPRRELLSHELLLWVGPWGKLRLHVHLRHAKLLGRETLLRERHGGGRLLPCTSHLLLHFHHSNVLVCSCIHQVSILIPPCAAIHDLLQQILSKCN